MGETIYAIRKDGKRERCKVTKVFEYSGLGTTDTPIGIAGNIIGLSGFEEIDIGDTLAQEETAEALPFVQIDPPTVEMQFSINDGPFAGREGKFVTSRQIRERLLKEM